MRRGLRSREEHRVGARPVAQWRGWPGSGAEGRCSDAVTGQERRPTELAAACVDSRRRQRRVLQMLERIRQRFLQAGARAGVAKLTGGWRVSAVLSADRTETRGVSVCGRSVDRNSNGKYSQDLN